MVDSAPPDIIAERIREATQLSRSVINNAHRRSKLVLQNVSATLSNELFLYRLMIYKDRGDES